MKAEIIAATKESNGLDKNFAKVFCGKNAGICYMEGTEFNQKITDGEKCQKRFDATMKNRHHSVADHMKVEVYFSGISKMLAILLNSLQDYATSEKSGRFTKMITEDPEEKRLYEKWMEIFKKVIRKRYEIRLDDKTIEKLAQENARYVLSVFTHSTSMGYSTSIRQWNYIYDWCEKLLNDPLYSQSEFGRRLKEDVRFLADFIKDNLYIENCRDTKNRRFSRLNIIQPKNVMKQKEILDMVYQTSYQSSFVSIAQAQQHRPIKYDMYINPEPPKNNDEATFRYHIPEILFHDETLRDEWIADLCSIGSHYPQASLIQIVEAGHIEDFVTKCKERLCGRAQLETMCQTAAVAQRMIRASADKDKDDLFKQIIEKELAGTHCGLKTKKEMSDMCVEPCVWGCNEAFIRII